MKQVVSTDKAPAAIGPYSQAIIANGFVFCAGQVGFDPATGQAVEGGVTEQTRRAMENVAALLAAAGTSFDKVVKTTVFLTTMDNFAAMNAVYAEYFPTQPPARSTVAVAQLPRNMLVEVEVIALV